MALGPRPSQEKSLHPLVVKAGYGPNFIYPCPLASKCGAWALGIQAVEPRLRNAKDQYVGPTILAAVGCTVPACERMDAQNSDAGVKDVANGTFFDRDAAVAGLVGSGEQVIIQQAEAIMARTEETA